MRAEGTIADRPERGVSSRSSPTVQAGLPPLIAALLRPEAYPHSADRLRLHETHVSWVVLAGGFAYKIKKPVDFGFLDFTTHERRAANCADEVRLNRRLCSDVYLGVVQTVERDGEYFVGDRDARSSRRFGCAACRTPACSLPCSHVAPSAVAWCDGSRDNSPTFMPRPRPRRALALTSTELRPPCAPTGRRTSPRPPRSSGGRSRRRPVSPSRVLCSASWPSSRSSSSAACARAGSATGTTTFTPAASASRSEACSSSTFSSSHPRFRGADVAAEVAFLAMDLDHHGRADLGAAFVDAYVRRSGDCEVHRLLDFYKCYRAFVRGKVLSFRLDEPDLLGEAAAAVEAEDRAYLDLAWEYAGGLGGPTVVVTMGLPASGKTTLARGLARHLGLVHLSSDVMRKQMAGLRPTDRRVEAYGKGIYGASLTRRTYAALRYRTVQWLRRGYSVVVDAIFGQVAERTAIERVAELLGATRNDQGQPTAS
jgi:uncharacterized protein